jgi:hypothetical protein
MMVQSFFVPSNKIKIGENDTKRIEKSVNLVFA